MEVEKIIPSKLETGFQRFLYRTVGERLPKNATPNQITLVGALCGLFGIICAFCAKFSPWFLFGTIFGIVGHLVFDDLDGYVARTKNMSSKTGAFLDLLTDILHITYLLIALAFANIVSFETAIFLVPLYALLMFVSMNYILYLKEFRFPRLGPIETHITLVILCAGGMVFYKTPIATLGGFGVKFGDVMLLIGGIPMYFETIRLTLQLFKRLKETEKNDGDS
ncbi:hypothetical protein FACS1894188_02460 [Clostridia bacterium]|nr:hypothetical protein FACS1894188_02460 [Clostridia bacterium]